MRSTRRAGGRIFGCFNEAGADCPGMPQLRWIILFRCARFNEAGADCPGMLAFGWARDRDIVASMRPGQTAPECASLGGACGPGDSASMRPGQTAPECFVTRVSKTSKYDRFNEAGADCPGMRELLR